MIINPANLNALFTTFDTRWTAQYAAFKPQSYYQRLAMTIPSNSSMSVYSWLAHLPRMREWLGPRMIRNIGQHTTALKNKKYELTIEVEREKLEDDQYDQYGIWMDQAASSVAKWPDQQIIPLLMAGNTGAFGTGFDGQNFFDTAHPVDGIPGSTGSGTQSNYFTNTPLNPYNFGIVSTSMMSIVGEDNQSLGVGAKLLVVSPQNAVMARTIANSPTFGQSIIDNGSSVAPIANPYVGTVQVLVIPELSAQPTAWYVLDDSQPVKPLIWQIRKEPEFVYRNQLTDEHVFNSDAFLYGIRARGAAGYGLWFLAAKAVG